MPYAMRMRVNTRVSRRLLASYLSLIWSLKSNSRPFKNWALRFYLNVARSMSLLYWKMKWKWGRFLPSVWIYWFSDHSSIDLYACHQHEGSRAILQLAVIYFSSTKWEEVFSYDFLVLLLFFPFLRLFQTSCASFRLFAPPHFISDLFYTRASEDADCIVLLLWFPIERNK